MKKEILLANDVDFLPVQIMVAGNFELLYEAGRTRYIKYNGEELLRMIYPALRAEDWATIQGKIINEKISDSENGFEISYNIEYDANNIKYKAEIVIICKNDMLEFNMTGEALSDFKSKRVGLCVHQPITTCGGREVTIIHPDNKSRTYLYPEMIAPVWPFTDITHMSWNTGHHAVELAFQGDLFETEDQRNWTDDSYKTYSGPQYKTPMLDIRKGDKMNHKIILKAGAIKNGSSAVKEVQPVKHQFPKIGYSRSKDMLTNEEIELLKKVPFDHYRVLLDLNKSNWKNVLSEATEEASKLDTTIELAVFFDVTQVKEFITALKRIVGKVGCLHILETDPTPNINFYKNIFIEVKKHFPELKTGFGNTGWFADINSCDIENIESDLFSFMVSPQVHQDDNRSILENLGSQHSTINTLRKRVGDKLIYISPVLFNSREDDARLQTEFAAWWTINTICNFADAGCITLYELKGSRGILHSPIYHLLETIKQFSPLTIARLNNEIVLENSDNDILVFKYA